MLGIDIGTGNVVSARQMDNQIVFKPIKDIFLKLDGTNDFTKKLMNQTKANFITKDNNIYIIGSEAEDFAALLNKEVQRPMKAGVISSSETEASEILEVILQAVAGNPTCENEILYFSVPANSVDEDNDTTFHSFLIQGIYNSMGYDARPLNEALAVAYSELGQDQLTGLCLSFGAGQVNACLSLLGAPVIQFSTARSGDYIDTSAARASGTTANKIRMIKESGLDLNQKNYKTREEGALKAYYSELIKYTITKFKQEFEKQNTSFDKQIPIIVSGGTSLPNGFAEMFEEVLRKSNFPLNISEVRRASDPLNAVAKGCLIAALSNED